jgi:hypothetical protein
MHFLLHPIKSHFPQNSIANAIEFSISQVENGRARQTKQNFALLTPFLPKGHFGPFRPTIWGWNGPAGPETRNKWIGGLSQ